MPARSDLDVTIHCDTSEFELAVKRIEKRMSRNRLCWNCRVHCVGLFCWDCVRSMIIGAGTALLVKWMVG